MYIYPHLYTHIHIYTQYNSVKHRLEAEKKAVEAEALAIDPEFKVFHVVMGPQQSLCT